MLNHTKTSGLITIKNPLAPGQRIANILVAVLFANYLKIYISILAIAKVDMSFVSTQLFYIFG